MRKTRQFDNYDDKIEGRRWNVNIKYRVDPQSHLCCNPVRWHADNENSTFKRQGAIFFSGYWIPSLLPHHPTVHTPYHSLPPLHTPFLPQYLRLPAPHRFLATPLFLLPVPYLLLYYPPCFPYLLSNPPYSLAAPLLDKTQLKPQQLFLMFNMFSMSFSNHISLAVIRCDTW